MPNKGVRWKKHFYTRSDGQSLIEWCEEHGVNYYVLRRRIVEHGMTVDEACESAGKFIAWKDTFGLGKNMSLRKYCRIHHLHYNTIYYRIKTIGLSLEDAVSYERNKKK